MGALERINLVSNLRLNNQDRFVEFRRKAILNDPIEVAGIVRGLLMNESTSETIGQHIVSIFKEQGECWDASEAFHGILAVIAEARAKHECAENPPPDSCADCADSELEKDPYGTGDSPQCWNCKRNGDCPWGMDK